MVRALDAVGFGVRVGFDQFAEVGVAGEVDPGVAFVGGCSGDAFASFSGFSMRVSGGFDAFASGFKSRAMVDWFTPRACAVAIWGALSMVLSHHAPSSVALAWIASLSSPIRHGVA